MSMLRTPAEDDEEDDDDIVPPRWETPATEMPRGFTPDLATPPAEGLSSLMSPPRPLESNTFERISISRSSTRGKESSSLRPNGQRFHDSLPGQRELRAQHRCACPACATVPRCRASTPPSRCTNASEERAERVGGSARRTSLAGHLRDLKLDCPAMAPATLVGATGVAARAGVPLVGGRPWLGVGRPWWATRQSQRGPAPGALGRISLAADWLTSDRRRTICRGTLLRASACRWW